MGNKNKRNIYLSPDGKLYDFFKKFPYFVFSIHIIKAAFFCGVLALFYMIKETKFLKKFKKKIVLDTFRISAEIK